MVRYIDKSVFEEDEMNIDKNCTSRMCERMRHFWQGFLSGAILFFCAGIVAGVVIVSMWR